MQYIKPFLFLFLLLCVATAVMGGSYCYQETANESDVADGSCSQSYTGSYAISGLQSSGHEGNYTFDANWSTYGTAAAANTMYVLVNYTKPADSNGSSYWLVKDADNTTNLTLLDSCWDYNAGYILVRLEVTDTGDSNDWECYNGTWETIRDKNGGECYEEAMWWYLDVDTCSYSSGAWSVTASDSCSWSSDVDLSGNDWTISGGGTVTSANVNFTNVNSLTVTDSVFVMNGGSVTVE